MAGRAEVHSSVPKQGIASTKAWKQGQGKGGGRLTDIQQSLNKMLTKATSMHRCRLAW